MIILKIGFKNFLKYFKENLTTGLIVLCCVLLFMFFSFVFQGLKSNMLNKIKQLCTGDYFIASNLDSGVKDVFFREYEPFIIDQKMKDQLTEIKGIKNWRLRYDFYAQLYAKNQSPIVKFQGFDIEKEVDMVKNLQIISGSSLTDGNDKVEILISKKMADKYEIKTNEVLTVLLRQDNKLLREIEARVRGIFKSKFLSHILDNYVYISLTQAQQILDSPQKATRINLFFDENADFHQTELNNIHKAFPDLEVFPWKQGASLFIGVYWVMVITYFTFVVIMGIIIISAISISTMMSMEERQRDLAVLFSLGGRRGQILYLVISEYFFLSGFFAIFGVIISCGLLLISRVRGIAIPNESLAFMFGGYHFYPAWDSASLLHAFIWSIVLTLLSAVAPVLKGVKPKNIIKMLNK